MSKRISRKAFLAMAATGAVGISPWLAMVETNAISVEHSTLRVPNWRGGKVRIAVVSDLHAHEKSGAKRGRRAVELALQERPDIIVMPGDFVSRAFPQNLINLRHALEPLADAACPVVGVLGNHDYATGAADMIVRVAQEYGVVCLRNHSVDLDGFVIAGVDDWLWGAPKFELLSELGQPPSTLVLIHEPDAVDLFPVPGTLQISGHSHGGQVCLPLGIPIHTPLGGTKYVRGYYPEAKTPLYVTRGIGTTGLGFRAFCPPEVSILTVIAA